MHRQCRKRLIAADVKSGYEEFEAVPFQGR
jgi:hypothetical protein